MKVLLLLSHALGVARVQTRSGTKPSGVLSTADDIKSLFASVALDRNTSNWSAYMASLFAHVGHVSGRRSQKKMVWSNAQAVVARVADKKVVVCDSPKGEFVTHSVGVRRLSLIPELPVSVSANGTDPVYAAVGFYLADHARKSNVWVLALVLVATGLGAVEAYLRNKVRDRFTASLARSAYFFRANAPGDGVAVVRTETASLARAAHESQPAGDARAVDLGRVMTWHLTSIVPQAAH